METLKIKVVSEDMSILNKTLNKGELSRISNLVDKLNKEGYSTLKIMYDIESQGYKVNQSVSAGQTILNVIYK